jgi:hypothetical protein
MEVDNEEMKRKGKKPHKEGYIIREGDDYLDLLDATQTSQKVMAIPKKQKVEVSDEVKINSEGKLIFNFDEEMKEDDGVANQSGNIFFCQFFYLSIFFFL